MKKVALSLIAIAMLVASCGPSAKEIEAKRVQDSIKVADSLCIVKAKADSIAKVIAIADSTKKADSIAKIKPVKKAKVTAKKVTKK